ncbi:MAG: thiol:disulfide interchange protein DsbA/DsbL [Glaciecola sp.]|jgi:thiol:disulfide interchange protein DsbA
MKKILISSVLAISTLLLSLSACAQVRFVEGEHYQVISKTASAEPVVKEFFSFWCPHCYNFEPLVAQMKKKLDPSVKFEKVHVNFMGFAGRDLQDEVTTGMLIGRVLKREQALNTAIFNYIHRQRATIANAEDVRSIFLVNGVTAEEFDKTKKSFAVKNMLRKNNKTIDEFRRFVSGVPNFIVNDKYQATFTRDMTPDDMVDLIVYLSELK